MTFLLIFIALSLVNVVIATIKSIITVKGGIVSASLINGVYFAFYNIMLLYTVADYPMWQKCVITFTCNVVGVAIVKLIEKKSQKDKLWKVEAMIHRDNAEEVKAMIKQARIPFNYIQGMGKYVQFNMFCESQAQSAAVKEILKAYSAKYFVSESKTL